MTKAVILTVYDQSWQAYTAAAFKNYAHCCSHKPVLHSLRVFWCTFRGPVKITKTPCHYEILSWFCCSLVPFFQCLDLYACSHRAAEIQIRLQTIRIVSLFPASGMGLRTKWPKQSIQCSHLLTLVPYCFCTSNLYLFLHVYSFLVWSIFTPCILQYHYNDSIH